MRYLVDSKGFDEPDLNDHAGHAYRTTRPRIRPERRTFEVARPEGDYRRINRFGLTVDQVVADELADFAEDLASWTEQGGSPGSFVEDEPDRVIFEGNRIVAVIRIAADGAKVTIFDRTEGGGL